MTYSTPTVNDLEEALAQARVTIDYLIADVVRLKDEAQQREERIRELEGRLEAQEIENHDRDVANNCDL